MGKLFFRPVSEQASAKVFDKIARKMRTIKSFALVPPIFFI